MKRRSKILLLIAGGLIAVVGVCFFCLREKEPSYNGRTLSEWLDRFVSRIDDPNSSVTDAGLEEAKIAVNAIGTNAAPRLLKWAVAKNTSFIRFLSRYPTVPGVNRLIKLFERDEHRGWIGLELLGRNALPYLRTQLNSPDPNIGATASQIINVIVTVDQSRTFIWAGPD